MKRSFPYFLLTLALVLMGRGRLDAQKADHPEEVFEREVQAVAQAWQFSGVDLPKGYVAVISAKGKWATNPDDGPTGPGGTRRNAPPNYVKGGAHDGCLLVRVGDTVLAFARDDEMLRITTPGKIYFCANDERTAEGARRGKHYLHALPIEGSKNSTGKGFPDNTGVMKVKIAVKKRE